MTKAIKVRPGTAIKEERERKRKRKKKKRKYSPSFLTRLRVIYLRRTVTARSQIFPIRREPDTAHDTIGAEGQLVFHS